jgi:hypothetical protein
MKYTFRIQPEAGRFTISRDDIKIFNPVNRTHIITVDNKHDFLKVMKRTKKLKMSSIVKFKRVNRAEKLKAYKRMYQGYSIKDLEKIGIKI